VDVRTAVDLGCGSGELTREPARRWPGARVTGVDNSSEMLARARTTGPGPESGAEPDGNVTFVLADLADVPAWSAGRTFDLVLSNAALQWVPDHERLIPELAAAVARGGVLAVQMPGNFRAPSHQAIESVIRLPRWTQALSGAQRPGESVRPLPWYAERLLDLGFSVDAWETTYLHLLRGERPVLEWIRGTALRPLLARLLESEQPEFLDAVNERLEEAYPPHGEVTVFPFRRVFFVALRSS
jgi:trans-aconitate 2-methyltransferase